MCLGIPGKVVRTFREHDVLMGKVQFGGISKRVCLEHVPEVRVDDYVLVHVGFALSKVSEEEAKDQLRILGEMGSAYAEELQAIGESVSLDLADTEGSVLSVSLPRELRP